MLNVLNCRCDNSYGGSVLYSARPRLVNSDEHEALQAKVIRNTLPQPSIPDWLDPLSVDVDDPKKLPLCWYGVAFRSDLVYKFAERVGLAGYLKFHCGALNPGDLDPYRTWVNFTTWFEKKSGLKLDLNMVWGHDVHILTMFSNHEIPRITDQMWRDACDLLDDMEFPWEYQLEWYLDRRLAVCTSPH